MITIKDIVSLSINEHQIKSLIKKVLLQDFNKIDNLRNRHPNVQFDSLLRGSIGEESLINWFGKYGIYFKSINTKINEDYNIDIDMVYENNYKVLNIEVKTSLIPDNYVKLRDEKLVKIEKVLQNFDIKLIRREQHGKKEKIEDLRSDIHIQIYFAFLREKRDNFLKSLEFNLNTTSKTTESLLNTLIDEIYNKIYAYLYAENTFFVGWIDKKTLIQQINTKYSNDPIWNFGKREFWRCNIEHDAKRPLDIIDYLKNIT